MSTDPLLQLDAYFSRIGDDGPRDVSLSTLNRIVEAHVRTIPFENLDIHEGREIVLDEEKIERKLIHDKRGGYCFEQNGLMQHVLGSLGFHVQAISARVRFQKPRSFTPPRTHMFLRVELEEGPWLVDVGVGGLTPTAALQLHLDRPQVTPHETRRIVATGDWSGFDQRGPSALLYHQALIGGVWEDVCEFTLEEMHPIDRELGNWFTSAHPDSHFRSQLTVARSIEAGRVTLLNRELKHRRPDGQATARTLETEEELLAALHDEFGLEFPGGTRFEFPALD